MVTVRGPVVTSTVCGVNSNDTTCGGFVSVVVPCTTSGVGLVMNAVETSLTSLMGQSMTSQLPVVALVGRVAVSRHFPYSSLFRSLVIEMKGTFWLECCELR